MKDDLDEVICINMNGGRLGFESRETLNEDERERADFHFGYCPACQVDLDFDFLMNWLGENNSRL